MTRPTALAFVLASCIGATASTDAWAQAWSMDLSASRTVYEPVAANVGTNNLVGTVRYDSRRDAWVYATAALPIADQAPFWDGAGLGGRLTLPGSILHRVTAGTDVGAHGFVFRDAVARQTGNGGIAEAMPFARVAIGAGSIEVRGGWRGQTLSFAGATQRRGVFETGARVGYDTAIHLGSEVRWMHASEGVYPFVGASFAYASASPVSVWARAGQWVGSRLQSTSWSIGTSIALTRRASFWVSAQQEGSDPLFWNAQRRSWTVGVTHRLSRFPAPPQPAASAEPDGVLIRIAAVDAPSGDISIAGSFNNWTPQPMQREGREWIIRLRLTPGVYQYAFRSSGGQWFVPASTPGRRDDGMGGREAVLVVS